MDETVRRPALSRRMFMRWVAAAGVGTTLAACGSASLSPSPTATELAKLQATTAAPTAAATAAATSEASATATTAPTASATATAAPTATATATTASPTAAPAPAYLAAVRGADPRAITRAAVAALGGMERFVKKGDEVIVKPNICVDYRTFEFGATTNPEVLAAVVEMCLAAGARRVRVMDSPFGGTPDKAYARSGIADAVKAAGGKMEVMNEAKFRDTPIPQGRDITRWPVYQEVLSADVLIDVPIAKHHSLARLSLAGKNLMGVVQDRGGLHANLGQRVADLVSLVRPKLTVVDAVRTLMANGPTGGSLDDVRLANTVIASGDIVAADAYAATLFGLTGRDIAYVRAAADMGLGTLDLASVRVEEIAL